MAWVKDEAFASEIGQIDRCARCVCAGERDHRHERLDQHAFAGKFAIVEPRPCERDVDAAINERAAEFGIVHRIQRQVHVGMRFAKRLQPRRQERIGR